MKVKPKALVFLLLASAAIGSMADRIHWSGQIVGSINLANVSISDANCSPHDWMEVARENGNASVMRYRCGELFWPFYKSGESALAATYFSDKQANTN